MNITTLGKTQKVLSFKPYGLMSSPPVNSIVGLWSQQAQESNGIGIADDPKNRPIKDMAEGEVALGNYVTGDYLYFDEDGVLDIKSTVSTKISAPSRVLITTPDVTTTGSVNVGTGETDTFVSLLGQVITVANGITVDIT
jgi:phage gp45-like